MRELFVLLVCFSFVWKIECQGNRRQNQRLLSNLPSALQEPYRDAISGYNNAETSTTSPDGDTPIRWSQFVPSRPAPHEVDCYIEVQVTERFGGRCTFLGGSRPRPICQSGALTGFTDECDRILSRGRTRSRKRRAIP